VAGRSDPPALTEADCLDRLGEQRGREHRLRVLSPARFAVPAVGIYRWQALGRLVERRSFCCLRHHL